MEIDNSARPTWHGPAESLERGAGTPREARVYPESTKCSPRRPSSALYNWYRQVQSQRP